MIRPDSNSAKISKGARVSFTAGNKVPAVGRKPEAEYVFLLDDDWSNSTALALFNEVSELVADDNGDLGKSDEKGNEEEAVSSAERDRVAEEEEKSSVEPEIVVYLKNYDVEQKQRDFDKESFSCGVCFEDKLGRKCTQFVECGHVFCKDCMAEYFRVQIREGQVNALNCPNSDCETQASHHQVRLRVVTIKSVCLIIWRSIYLLVTLAIFNFRSVHWYHPRCLISLKGNNWRRRCSPCPTSFCARESPASAP